MGTAGVFIRPGRIVRNGVAGTGVWDKKNLRHGIDADVLFRSQESGVRSQNFFKMSLNADFADDADFLIDFFVVFVSLW